MRSSPRRLPVYVLPCRVQQGWGDLVEMARACTALPPEEFRLLSLRDIQRPAPEARSDPRFVPGDLGHQRWLGFPSLEMRREPLRKGPAAILVTWWGMTGRHRDSEGRRVPGTFASTIERIQRAHAGAPVLIVSLEEFAGTASSRTNGREALRQAGWGRDRISRFLKASPGEERMRRYHGAVDVARGAEASDVLHLVATFSHSSSATREFPYLVEVGPYGLGAKVASPPPSGQSVPTVLWYLSGEVPEPLVEAFLRLRRARVPFRWRVRAAPRSEDLIRTMIEREGDPGWAPRFVGTLKRATWGRELARADLLIVGGGQSLVDALAAGRPFLYHHGSFQGDRGEPPRAFRREILRSLLPVLRAAGVPGTLRRDLSDFADGRRMYPILARSLGSPAWREKFDALYRRENWPPVLLPGPRRLGGPFLAGTLRHFARHEGSVAEFVGSLRTEAAREALMTARR